MKQFKVWDKTHKIWGDNFVTFGIGSNGKLYMLLNNIYTEVNEDNFEIVQLEDVCKYEEMYQYKEGVDCFGKISKM